MKYITLSTIVCLLLLCVPNAPAADDRFTEAQQQQMYEWLNWHLYSETATTKDIIRWLKTLPLKDVNFTLISEVAYRAGKNPNLTFSLTPTDVSALKNAGASDDLIRAMRSPRWAIAFNEAQSAASNAAAISRAAPAPSTAKTAGPVQFTSEEGGYSLEYPAQPEKKDWAVGNAHASAYFVTSDNVIYMSAYGVYDQDVDTDRELQANATSFAKEAKAKITENKPKRFVRGQGDELPALECTIERDNALGRCLSVMDGRRIYLVVGFSVKPNNGQAEIDRFLKSLKLAQLGTAKSGRAPATSTANSILLASNAAVPAAGGAASSGSQSNVELIIDASGSMATKIQGRSKMEIAKQALTELLLSLPPTTNVAVRAYGHRSKKDCADIELLANFGQQRSAIAARVSTLKPFGMTPLASSITEAAKDFAGREGQDNTVILITDGEETCNGNPCEVARVAHQGGVKVKINVIGFKIEPKERAQLECIANAGGGKYVSANDAKELTVATQQLAPAPIVSAPPPAPAATANPTDNNILAQANGGQVVVAPNDLWTQTNDGKEDTVPNSPVAAISVGQEAVYAFKDEQPATFDKFATLVPDTSSSNLKEFELLVSDDSPTGNFRSIGRFTVQNAKMLKSPYQEFKFEPVTAKYLKVKLVSNYGGAFGSISVYEFKLFGKTNVQSAAAETAPAEKKSEEQNILAQSAGGQVVVAPNDLWTRTNDGKEDPIPGSPVVAINVGQEAVYAFKDEQPATFDKFATLVPTTDSSNLKEFELLVSDDSPTGNFRSIGRFTAQNVKLMKSPYQEFKFEPVTAKYLKIKLISNYGGAFGGLNLYEFKLFGKTNVQSSAASSSASTEERVGQTSGASTATPAAKAEGKNILAQSEGGQVLVAPNDLWAQTNDGKEDQIPCSGNTCIGVGQEAVYAFKDEQPATFDKFATLVPDTSNANLKEFELLVADDSPTGSFRSVGRFTVQNVKLMKSPYQEFKFEPVRAKYLKIKLLSNYGAAFNGLNLYEFKLFGSLGK